MAWPHVSAKALCVCGTVTESELGTAVLFPPDLHVQGRSVWDTAWMESRVMSVVLGMPTCLVITAQLDGQGESQKRGSSVITQHPTSDLVHLLPMACLLHGSSYHPFSASPPPGGHSQEHPAQSSGSPLWHAELDHDFE